MHLNSKYFHFGKPQPILHPISELTSPAVRHAYVLRARSDIQDGGDIGQVQYNIDRDLQSNGYRKDEDNLLEFNEFVEVIYDEAKKNVSP